MLKATTDEAPDGDRTGDPSAQSLMRYTKKGTLSMSYVYTTDDMLFRYSQVGLATFAVYIFTKDDHRIDAQTAFVAITLFNILRFAVLVAPIMVMELVKVFLSTF